MSAEWDRDEFLRDVFKDVERATGPVKQTGAKPNGPEGLIADDLPELIIDGSNLTGTAKQLAELIAEHRRFLFNGHEPIQVVQENEEMPRAVTVTPEAVRVFAHEICTPVKFVKDKMIAQR